MQDAFSVSSTSEMVFAVIEEDALSASSIFEMRARVLETNCVFAA